MKKIIAYRLMPVIFLMFALSTNVFSQRADHVDGGTFTKRIDYNIVSWIVHVDENGTERPSYNMESKSTLEKLFFGDYNAPVEYIFSPSYEVREPAGAIRIVKGPSSEAPYTLEVKWITNWREALKELEPKYPLRGLTMEEMNTISKAEQERIAEHNIEMGQKLNEEIFDRYEIRTLSFPLHHLGGRLCDKMTDLIVGFKAEGKSAMIFDGYEATFRCVVGDEVWTLTIHEPQKRALQMSNLCRQIIEDVTIGDKFDEWKYIRMLEPIEF